MIVSMLRVDGFFRASVMLNKVTVSSGLKWLKRWWTRHTGLQVNISQTARKSVCFIEYQFIFFLTKRNLS